MRRNRRRRARGFMLLIVLTLIATLLLVGALVYQQSHDTLMTSSAMKSRAIAAARAEQGAQAAMVDVSNNYAGNVAGLLPCASLSTCTAAQIYSKTLDLGAGGDVTLGEQNASGGGLQYMYQVYLRTNPSGVSPTVVITSTGYVGYSADPTHQLSSVVEVEALAPVSNASYNTPGGAAQQNYAGGG